MRMLSSTALPRPGIGVDSAKGCACAAGVVAGVVAVAVTIPSTSPSGSSSGSAAVNVPVANSPPPCCICSLRCDELETQQLLSHAAAAADLRARDARVDKARGRCDVSNNHAPPKRWGALVGCGAWWGGGPDRRRCRKSWRKADLAQAAEAFMNGEGWAKEQRGAARCTARGLHGRDACACACTRACTRACVQVSANRTTRVHEQAKHALGWLFGLVHRDPAVVVDARRESRLDETREPPAAPPGCLEVVDEASAAAAAAAVVCRLHGVGLPALPAAHAVPFPRRLGVFADVCAADTTAVLVVLHTDTCGRARACYRARACPGVCAC